MHARSNISDLQHPVLGKRKLKIQAILLNDCRTKVGGDGVNGDFARWRIRREIRKEARRRKRLRKRIAKGGSGIGLAGINAREGKGCAKDGLKKSLPRRQREEDAVA
jgi:hypothetical protein